MFKNQTQKDSNTFVETGIGETRSKIGKEINFIHRLLYRSEVIMNDIIGVDTQAVKNLLFVSLAH